MNIEVGKVYRVLQDTISYKAGDTVLIEKEVKTPTGYPLMYDKNGRSWDGDPTGFLEPVEDETRHPRPGDRYVCAQTGAVPVIVTSFDGKRVCYRSDDSRWSGERSLSSFTEQFKLSAGRPRPKRCPRAGDTYRFNETGDDHVVQSVGIDKVFWDGGSWSYIDSVKDSWTLVEARSDVEPEPKPEPVEDEVPPNTVAFKLEGTGDDIHFRKVKPNPPTRDELLAAWCFFTPPEADPEAWKHAGVAAIGGEHYFYELNETNVASMALSVWTSCHAWTAKDSSHPKRVYLREVERKKPAKRWWAK